MFFRQQKVFFKVNDEEGEGISLSEALAGSAGTVNLGKRGVHLWTPNSIPPKSGEMICDLRWEAISDAVYEKFKEASEGHFLPAHCVLFRGGHPKKIEHALKFFDYVMIPSKKIKNLPSDFRKRVLGYEAVKLDEY